MGLIKRLLNPLSWFTWTPAGLAVSHATMGHPHEVQILGGVDYTLWDLRHELFNRVRTLGLTPATPAGATADFDHVCQDLRILLTRRGLKLGSLEPHEFRELCEELVAILAEAQKRASANGTGHVIELTHAEACFIDAAERKIDRLHESWEGWRNNYEQRMNAERLMLGHLSEKVEQLHDKHRAKGFQAPYTPLPRWGYWMLMIILASGEFPANRDALQIMNDETGSWTVEILSTAITAVALTLGHIGGAGLRHLVSGAWIFSKLVNFLVLCAAFLSIVLLVTSIAFLRYTWTSYSMSDVALTPEQFREIGVAFLFLNLVFSIAGVTLSYFSHDEDAELEELWHEKQTLRRRLTRQWRRYGRAARKFDTLRGQCIDKVSEIRNTAYLQIDEYRTFNTVSRDSPQPQSFGKGPDKLRLFRPRDFAHEVDPTPWPIADLLRRLESDAVQAQPKRANEEMQKLESTAGIEAVSA
jgi:hypothetical protein